MITAIFRPSVKECLEVADPSIAVAIAIVDPAIHGIVARPHLRHKNIIWIVLLFLKYSSFACFVKAKSKRAPPKDLTKTPSLEKRWPWCSKIFT